MGGAGLGQEEPGALGLDQPVAWGAGGVSQSGGVHGFAGDLPPPIEATSVPEGGSSSFTDGLAPPGEQSLLPVGGLQASLVPASPCQHQTAVPGLVEGPGGMSGISSLSAGHLPLACRHWLLSRGLNR